MSRSRRKTPKKGITAAASEKADKMNAHRRARRATKVAVEVEAREGDDGPIAEVEHPRSGSWRFAKDGKHWFEPGGEQWRIPKRKSLLRK
jgi:hypothetical protein